MSDRTSAGIFGVIFNELADMADVETTREMAKRFWRLSHEYDFHASDMDEDRALVQLGLAETRPSKDGDYDEVRYRKSNGRSWGDWV